MDEGWWEQREGKITRFLGKQARHQVASELVPVDKPMFRSIEDGGGHQNGRNKVRQAWLGSRTSQRNWTLVLASCTQETAYSSGSALDP